MHLDTCALAKFIAKCHANLVFQACISFLRCFRKENLRKCWQFSYLVYRCVYRFSGVSDKSGAFLFSPSSHGNAVPHMRANTHTHMQAHTHTHTPTPRPHSNTLAAFAEWCGNNQQSAGDAYYLPTLFPRVQLQTTVVRPQCHSHSEILLLADRGSLAQSSTHGRGPQTRCTLYVKCL